MSIYIGIDLGGTNIKALAVDGNGVKLAEAGGPTRDGEYENGEPAFASAVADCLAQLERDVGERADGVGLSAPGLASHDGTAISFMPGRMHGLEGLNWGKRLNRPEGVPVQNDAHAALLGEHWVGAAAGCDNVVMFTLGTGVGGAIICDGRLLKGHIGRAGHLGHISIRPDGGTGATNLPGTIELSISEGGLQRKMNGAWDDVAALVAAARNGDEQANALWDDAVCDFARGVASVINAVDPHRIVVGGGIAKADDLLFKPLRAHLDRIEWRPGGHKVEIVPAQLGGSAGAYGAARSAQLAPEGDVRLH